MPVRPFLLSSTAVGELLTFLQGWINDSGNALLFINKLLQEGEDQGFYEDVFNPAEKDSLTFVPMADDSYLGPKIERMREIFGKKGGLDEQCFDEDGYMQLRVGPSTEENEETFREAMEEAGGWVFDFARAELCITSADPEKLMMITRAFTFLSRFESVVLEFPLMKGAYLHPWRTKAESPCHLTLSEECAHHVEKCKEGLLDIANFRTLEDWYRARAFFTAWRSLRARTRRKLG